MSRERGKECSFSIHPSIHTYIHDIHTYITYIHTYMRKKKEFTRACVRACKERKPWLCGHLIYLSRFSSLFFFCFVFGWGPPGARSRPTECEGACELLCAMSRAMWKVAGVSVQLLCFQGTDAVDFRSRLAAEAGTTNDAINSNSAQIVARLMAAKGNLTLTGTEKSASISKSIAAHDVEVEERIEGKTLVVDTLTIDEIIATGPLSIEGLLGMVDSSRGDGSSFLEYSSMVDGVDVLYESDALGVDPMHGWNVLHPVSRGSVLRRAEPVLVTQTCGSFSNILGGPCQPGSIVLDQTFVVSGKHCEVCLEFEAHFFDQWSEPAGADFVYASIDEGVVWMDTHASPTPNSSAFKRAPNICGDDRFPETKLGVHTRVCVPHTRSTVDVVFGGSVSTSDACRQSWGVSNVRVSSHVC